MSIKSSDLSDDFSDEISVGNDEPPTLNETIFDISLFYLFHNYMKSQQLGGDALFLKQARYFHFMKLPREVVVKQAINLIWTFFTEGAPHPISVSDEIRKKIVNIAFDPEADSEINTDMFSVAFEQVYNVVVPHFRNWISTGEWREAVPFHHIPPPTFDVVLACKPLRFLFHKFLKAQVEGDEALLRALHLWKFCVIANDFREGKYNHSVRDDKKKKKKDGDVDDDDEEEEEKGLGEKVTPEEYAKRICKKFKHYISLEYSESFTYEVFIIRALDQTISEFDKSALFQNWLGLKQYQSVDYTSKTVHQSMNADGYTEPPTLAAGMTSCILPFFMVFMAGTENGLNLEFLVDVIKFRKQYENVSEGSSSGGSSSDTARKNMVEEAKRIFTKYLDSDTMYCDPRLVEEVRSVISKRGGKGITPTLFRKCGAFIYQRAEHTWCREARGSLTWTNRSYDNRCKSARAIEEEFSMSILPEGIDLQVVPTIDDTLGNSVLFEDYNNYILDQGFACLRLFYTTYLDYFGTSADKRNKDKLVKVIGDVAAEFPDIAPVYKCLEKENAKRKCITDATFGYCMTCIVRTVAKRFFAKWLVDHAMVWKEAKWNPVPSITFSDLSNIFSTKAIEKKILDEAVKGKSGFSKYLAKRRAKQQSIGNVRSQGGAVIKDTSNTVFTTRDSSAIAFFGDSDKAALESAVPEDFDFEVPSLLDTLASPYLRRYFYKSVLSVFLPPLDANQCEDLMQFYEKYLYMDVEKLLESQDEMRKDIERICEKHKHYFKKADRIRERAKKLQIISPQFFRPEEMELYKDHYPKFEKVLRDKGWK